MDGCAIFWRQDKYFLSCCLVFFSSFRFRFVCEHGISFKVSNFLDRDNVALIVELAFISRSDSPHVLVATTHVLYNEKRGDVKLGQLKLLTDAIAAVRGQRNIPIVLSGDFNLVCSLQCHYCCDRR